MTFCCKFDCFCTFGKNFLPWTFLRQRVHYKSCTLYFKKKIQIPVRRPPAAAGRVTSAVNPRALAVTCRSLVPLSTRPRATAVTAVTPRRSLRTRHDSDAPWRSRRSRRDRRSRSWWSRPTQMNHGGNMPGTSASAASKPFPRSLQSVSILGHRTCAEPDMQSKTVLPSSEMRHVPIWPRVRHNLCPYTTQVR